MEYSPPPLFKRGASARAKAVICTLLALALLIADSRLHALLIVRQAVGTALYPLQMAALMPRDAANKVVDYFSALSTVEKENQALRSQQGARAQQLQQAQLLAAENAQLRKMLGAQQRLQVKSVMSEILYDARDQFARKVIMDRGSQQGVATGQPVIDDAGIVGQVTRVFPFTSEVTLLTDKDQAIPVQVLRNGLRSVAYGRGQSGYLDLRFMSYNADIQKGDLLVTSGIDGVYPAGLAVAKVVQVESKSTDAFAHIVCEPVAGIDRHTQLLILLVDPNPVARPDDEPAVVNSKNDVLNKRRLTDSTRDKTGAAKEVAKDAAKDGGPEAARKNQNPRSAGVR
ncbi:rod shape-determining protein MreC [Collimonas sp.]|jgi:rod shape-determining protein MreC|uniref:rod shape-determining protein MreC n=1 Tax=Collimonas sp. TaxID=1963772 RepID=UPI0037C047E5